MVRKIGEPLATLSATPPRPLYVAGLFVLCPTCDRDALEIVEDVLPLTPIAARYFRPVAPTRIVKGEPILSGCCGSRLMQESTSRKGLEFVAMRTKEGWAGIGVAP